MLAPREQHVHYDGTRPDVDGFGVRLLADDLGSHVQQGAAVVVRLKTVGVDLNAQPEVCYFDSREIVRVVEEYVL